VVQARITIYCTEGRMSRSDLKAFGWICLWAAVTAVVGAPTWLYVGGAAYFVGWRSGGEYARRSIAAGMVETGTRFTTEGGR
jgi:hypothetical protein